MNLRRKSDVKNITIRQFQAMQRLAVVFAKLRLEDKIIKEDIENAIKLVVQTYEKLMGILDFDFVTEGIGDDARKMKVVVLGLIPESGNPVSYDHIKEYSNISDEDLNETISRLKSKGDIHEPKPDHYLKQ
jgi:DNA replicative helicase MCM subunit Mcm2 (Cdc46/Mcm family)